MTKLNQIGLTHTERCDEDKRWHQAVGSLFWDENRNLKERDFTHINVKLKNLCPYIWEVCNDMKSKLWNQWKPIAKIPNTKNIRKMLFYCQLLQ